MDYKLLFSNRIKIILNDIYKGNYTKFAKAIGVTEGSIRAYIGEKRDARGNIKITMPTADKVVAIIENIGINSEWLLFGKGDMFFKQKEVKMDEAKENRLYKLIESQQETIASQQETLKTLIGGDGKNGTADTV